MVRDNTSEVKCVFLDILATANILSAGQWSERGCARNENLSNNSITVCECDHLTHFATLLSAAPLNLTDAVVLSLEIIGHVGVSVSLVAMVLTIFTFIAFKYACVIHTCTGLWPLPLSPGHFTTCVTTSTSTSASASG